MSLQVWLPLTKDLRNQGLSNVTVTNNGATFNSNGKLGGCYTGRIDVSSSIIPTVLNNTEFTVAFWIYIIEVPTVSGVVDTYVMACGSGGTRTQFHIAIRQNGAGFAFCFYSDDYTFYNTVTDKVGKWMHVVCAFKNNTQIVYVDGIKIGERATAGGLNIAANSVLNIYAAHERLNDVRIYDHALSPLEVKHLAQGLVLHYPLNREGLGATNLLKNGFGELNMENWSNSNVYTDAPSGHAEIKKSYRDNESLEYIPLVRNCTYKFSCWIKAAYSSGYSYPSLKPYDADKLFINTNNCREGFSLSTMTTLKQQLNPGDTKIYVDDLSAWNANSGHYYDTAAIFSYTDGQGYTWPDGTYTRNCPAFSSGTEAKTNLDKTNNVITLLSAYTGPIMPVGTKVCASTYGSTFFYPLGSISNSTISDWTYKEGIFSSQHSRLECAKYIRVYAYSSCYQAGMTLSNQTLEDMTNNIEYDCSGYGNNGTRNGVFSWSGDTPRYGCSTIFNGIDNAIQTPNLTTMITDKNYTISCWTYKTVIGTKNYQTIYGGPSGFELEARNVSGTDPLFRIHNWGGGTTPYVFGEWTHFCFVHTDSDSKLYINGELKITGSSVNIPSGNYYIGAWSVATSQNYDGLMSDFRIYATALSADDVMALYKNAGYVDSDGNVYAYEMTE